MHHHYEDIRNRIAEEPKWWDEYAVPRYCDFHPSEIANIYANEVILMEIECQGCGYKFDVCMSWHPYMSEHTGFSQMLKFAKERNIDWLPNYGDPPNIGCCPSGPTMSSTAVKILESWSRNRFDWVKEDLGI